MYMHNNYPYLDRGKTEYKLQDGLEAMLGCPGNWEDIQGAVEAREEWTTSESAATHMLPVTVTSVKSVK
jgi:hypothetical protein